MKIHECKAESLRVALRPFEIIEQTPRVIATDVRAILDRAPDGAKIGAEKIDSALIGHSPMFVGLSLIHI